MKNTSVVILVVFIVLMVLLLVGPFYTLDEGEQAVVIRFGEIIREETSAGLKIKIPFIDNVERYSKKILSWDGEPQRVQTKENQFIWVDVTARWRIVNPRRFYAAVTTVRSAVARLDDILDSVVRTTVADNYLREAVRNSNIINDSKKVDIVPEVVVEAETAGEMALQFTSEQVKQETIQKGRKQLSETILQQVTQNLPDIGIEVIDVIFRQIRYSDDLTNAVYSRMIKDRNQIAQRFRSYGEGQKLNLLGQTEQEKLSILSRARAEAETIRGNADAQAAQIYSRAYNADPEFYQFWRAIESYRLTLPKFNKTLTTDMNYFNFLYSPAGR
ncbi:MAG: protease modulator HflC [Spirochaetales bacterium]|jgi:membrane protease subunit HflC|nr:protease modulator HflC [Spirochaetales bacterium]